MKLIILTILTILLSTITTKASKILFLFPIGSKSHKNVFDPIVEALALRNHSITVVSMVKTSYPYENIKEFVPLEGRDFNKNFGDPFEARRVGHIKAMGKWKPDFTYKSCEEILDNPEFDKILDQSYDLIIMNGFLNNCLEGHVWKNGAPFLFITSMAPPFYVAERVGNRMPSSFIPFPMMDLSDKMTFMERLTSTTVNFLIRVIWNTKTLSTLEDIYRQRLGAHVPSIVQIENNVSLILSNSHPLITFPRPLHPNLIEIGGVHCRKVKPLPKDLEDFVQYKEGFIFFSLGSIVQAKDMPEETRGIFLRVFSKLKQRVLWKWEGEEMKDLPENVRLVKWAPQQDLLGHKNIKLFITHGGLLSIMEALYHAVPLLGFPIFIDQDMNLRQSKKWGYSLNLNILEMTEDQLYQSISQLINEPKFSQKAVEYSEIFRDSIEAPLDRAVYWIEYVIRHKGASYLSSPAKDLNIFQYNSVDVIGFLAGVFLLILWILRIFIRRILSLISNLFRNKNKSKCD